MRIVVGLFLVDIESESSGGCSCFGMLLERDGEHLKNATPTHATKFCGHLTLQQIDNPLCALLKYEVPAKFV